MCVQFAKVVKTDTMLSLVVVQWPTSHVSVTIVKVAYYYYNYFFKLLITTVITFQFKQEGNGVIYTITQS